ncbi:MAG: M1 family metallopeptidase [Acidobacteria bacterium]|nr:M1 family metallopeptidase [Acidobacteriota bacterium]
MIFADRPVDPHSFANTQEVVHDHLDLKFKLDFEAKVIHGTATLRLVYAKPTQQLVLDTRDLIIDRVFEPVSGENLSFELGPEQAYLGRALKIDLGGKQPQQVAISYHSQPQAAALQWLAPSQTTSKKLPFLFTQSQAILARTWIPCMDSPGVRVTFNASVDAPKGIRVIMGAKHTQEDMGKGHFEFAMPYSIPPYLIALAAGELEFKAMSKRTGVYAEPAVVEKAAWEFADAEKMIEATESIYGPYDWERWDILVLPPSFPFGGMENPMLTFATPTVIAGDRSLVSLLAHELAHSWSGNLVTNATWNDFWLNEGTTTYTEARIMEVLLGPDFANMHRALGQQDLRETVQDMSKSPDDTHLFLNLKDRDPDDGMTDIAYEKGANFLTVLEHHFGREKWDAFLKNYFRSNAFSTITTEAFLKQLKEGLFKDHPEDWQKLKVEDWVFGPGIPDNLVQTSNPLGKATDEALAALKAGKAPAELETKGWITQQWLDFIRNLPEMDNGQMKALDDAFNFSKSGNSEILFAWVMRAIPADYQAAYPAMEHFLTHMGRRKFLKPIYQELMKHERTQALAKSIYAKARDGYHPISVTSLDPVLDFKP